MKTPIRIYAGGAFAFGKQPAVDDILNGGYTALIVWSVHVNSAGDLILNNTQMVSGGVYKEAEQMNLPSRLAQLHKAGIKIIFSVGSGGSSDYQNIGKLLNGGVPGPGNALYDNFKALKDAMVAAGGDIEAIDYDNEEPLDAQVMINFGSMLFNIGYSSVTLCPYYTDPAWNTTYNQLLSLHGKGFVSAIHLQCYSGGRNSTLPPWGKMIASAGGNTLLIPGLATNQAQAGPWWNGQTNAQGGSVVKTDNIAMYGKGDWSNMLRVTNYASPDKAMQSCSGAESFFFYCRGNLDLGPGKQFKTGDAVFFSGLFQWGSAPQCDGYSLSGGCSNIYNNNGACPSDLKKQYATWKAETYPPNGGFLWMYDSIVNCILSGCCGGSEKNPATTAKDYATAMAQGLT